MLRKTLVIVAMLIVLCSTVVCGLSGADATAEPKHAAGEPTATQVVEPTQPPVEEDVEEVTTPTPEPTATPTLEPTPTEVVIQALTAQEAYDLALAEAQAWQPDAVLNEMGTSLPGPLDAEGKSKGWAIKFWSPAAKELNSMSFVNGKLNTTPIPLPDARAVPDMDTIIMDLKSIYDTGAAAGGNEYLTAGYIAMAGLVAPGGGSDITRWVINYQHPQNYTVGYTVQMDARSGDVTLALAVVGLQPVETTEETDAAANTDAAADTGVASDTASSDPVILVQIIFDAAKSGNFIVLKNLCDPLGENDNDTQMICDLATDDSEADSFIEYFEKGKINGDAQISPNGNEAAVPFLFGPNGDDEETMELINRDGQWYLSDF